jgi:hypothetical protein
MIELGKTPGLFKHLSPASLESWTKARRQVAPQPVPTSVEGP